MSSQQYMVDGHFALRARLRESESLGKVAENTRPAVRNPRYSAIFSHLPGPG
jgi:hypothetical protein